MKKYFLSIFFCLFFFVFVSTAEAKVLPRFKKATTGGSGSYRSVGVSVRFRPDRLALLVSFSNLNLANNISYTLMYQSNSVDQGVSGSLDESHGNYVTRELLFGTCSAGVCRYHEGLANMKLEISSNLKSGKQAIRRFRIKI